MNPPSAPFSTALLDDLMEEAGMNAVLVSSPHNLRYFMDGYRFFLYDKLDSVGLSRYAPILGYVRGRPEQSFYVGWGDEGWGLSVEEPWVAHSECTAWTAAEAAARAAELLLERVGGSKTVGLEPPYVSSDASALLTRALPSAEFVDACMALDELRAVKSAAEITAMREGADLVAAAMVSVFEQMSEGLCTRDLVERLRQQETRLGLDFDYCLVAAAPDVNRGPSTSPVLANAAVSLDSGAAYEGFVADLARMGIVGAPNALHTELLALVDEVQQAAREQVAAGALGGRIMEAGRERIANMPWPERFSMVAHGMGRRSHEAPRLNEGKPPYPPTHRDRPLQAGMVLSIETHVIHPDAGFVKLEDAVVVTSDGYEAIGDIGRAWTRSDA